MSRVLLTLLRFYQWFISPLLGRHCRFEPSCSHYAATAVQYWGPLRGSHMAISRLCRCHPWGGAGFDPVPLPELPPSLTDR